ncbi:MAG: hypothetical protein IT380_10025 [Myxococcales bacterium]|nr:hypothetical protein [Myxococcales bacterium]
MASKANRIWAPSDSKAQEAFCRHQMIAEIYCHAARTKRHIEVLSHDIDVNGVDLTLVHDGTVVPLQLKSRIDKSTTKRWDVRRRIIFPATFSVAHRGLFDSGEPTNEGLGGALLVQDTVEMATEPFVRLWYRVGRLDLIRLRSEKRFNKFIKASEACPDSLTLWESSLTPPLTIGEVLWLLLDIDSLSPLVSDCSAPWLVIGNLREDSTSFEAGRQEYLAFEKAAKARFKTVSQASSSPTAAQK